MQCGRNNTIRGSCGANFLSWLLSAVDSCVGAFTSPENITVRMHSGPYARNVPRNNTIRGRCGANFLSWLLSAVDSCVGAFTSPENIPIRTHSGPYARNVPRNNTIRGRCGANFCMGNYISFRRTATPHGCGYNNNHGSTADITINDGYNNSHGSPVCIFLCLPPEPLYRMLRRTHYGDLNTHVN
jgi:hypothetical protein